LCDQETHGYNDLQMKMKIDISVNTLTDIMQRYLNLMLSLLLFSIAGYAQTPPRLWEADIVGRDGAATKIYLLGITHQGINAEYDDYFFNVVLPAAKKSDALSYEGANPTVPMLSFPACLTDLKNPASKAKIDDVRRIVRRLDLKMKLQEQSAIKKMGGRAMNDAQVKSWSKLETDQLSEFGLIFAMNIVAAYFQPPPKANVMHPDRLKATQLSVPFELARLNPSIPTFDVDLPMAAWQSYCDIGEPRIKFFESRTNAAKAKLKGTLPSLAEIQSMDSLTLEFTNTVLTGRRTGSLAYFPEQDESVICRRNREWIKKISEPSNRKTTFYALGIFHFFPIEHQYAHCDGLLADLRKQGMTVKLVER
jgi:TraB/PrgY/gumN family